MFLQESTKKTGQIKLENGLNALTLPSGVLGETAPNVPPSEVTR